MYLNAQSAPRADIGQQKLKSLFTDIPSHIERFVTSENFPSWKNLNHLKARFRNLPPRISLLRQRDYGLDLSQFGFNGFILDPKIGISFLPLYVAEKYSFERIVQIQGYRGITNNAPYSFYFGQDYDTNLKFLLTGLIKEDIESESAFDFISHFLPIFLVGKEGKMDKLQYLQLKQEYEKTLRKINNILHYLEPEKSDYRFNSTISLDNEEVERIQEVFKQIVAYEFRGAALGIKSFVYDVLSKKYTETAKKGMYLDTRELEIIKELIKIPYPSLNV